MMGKRIKCCFLVLLCISLFLSACSDNDTSNNDSNDISSVQKHITKTEDASNMLPYEYDVIINNIINAYPWNDDEINTVPENPELSYMYRHNSTLSEIGFALIDLDNNGQKELIISDINKPFIYDLYTISDGEAIHLFDSGERYFYYIYQNGHIEYQWSGSAVTSGHDFYELRNGTLEFIERIAFDANHALDAGLIDDISEANDDNCSFRSETDQPEDYVLVTFDKALKTIEVYRSANEPLDIEYTLLSEYSNTYYSVSQNEDLTYSYQICDKKRNVLFSDESSMKEPDIRRVSENVYSATIQTGTGISTNWAVFCDVESGRVSDTFHAVLGAQDKYVIFADYSDGIHYILVQNIFDANAYRKAYDLRETGAFADPILGISFTEEGHATVTYLTGDEADASETSITIQLP